MELEKQVCSLELARRLKELGVRQDYQPYDAYWVKTSNGEWHLLFLEYQEDPPTQTPLEHYRAFTVAELGEMLPSEIETPDEGQYWGGGTYYLIQIKDYVAYGQYGTEVIPDTLCVDIETTEADARAKMLIYLIENKFITV